MRSGPGPDLGAAASVLDPAGYFASHRTNGAVQWSDAQRGWVVLGHTAAQAAFTDSARLSADRIGALERFAAGQPATFGRVVDLLRGWMIFRDPPAHTRLREPVRRSFTNRRVHALQTTIVEIADGLLDGLADDRGDVDVHARFSRPFPALVIGALLGLEDADPTRLQEWSDTLASIVFAIRPSTSASTEAVVEAAAAFESYFGPLVVAARRHGGDDLVAQVASIDDGDFSDIELVGLCTMLLFAGHETTTSLLTSSLAWLLDDPRLLERFATTRATGDLRAVDELVRVCGPARTMVRKVAVAHEREGAHLQEGDNVFISIVAADHDPAVFVDPGRIDLGRDPNPHLGFGWGLHHCLGAQLARLEAAIALGRLVDRFPGLQATAPVPPPRGSVLGLTRHPGLVRLR